MVAITFFSNICSELQRNKIPMLKSSIDLSQGDCVKIKYKLNSNEFSTFFSFILLSRYTIVKYRVFRADLINLFVFIELFMRIRRIFQLKQLNFNVTNKRFHFDPPDTFLFSLSSKFKLEKTFTSRILFKVVMKQTYM